jgi:hypothetical protein
MWLPARRFLSGLLWRGHFLDLAVLLGGVFAALASPCARCVCGACRSYAYGFGLSLIWVFGLSLN